MDRRPTTDLSFGKISKGDMSARGHPIHFMFGSRVGFSGSADRMALFRVGPKSRHVGENNARGVIRLVTIYSISCVEQGSLLFLA